MFPRRTVFPTMLGSQLIRLRVCCSLLVGLGMGLSANAQPGLSLDPADDPVAGRASAVHSSGGLSLASSERRLLLPPYRLSPDSGMVTALGAADGSERDRWRATPPAEPDWRGAGRDVGYYLGYQVVGVAILYALPEGISGWSSEDKNKYSFDTWRENVSKAVWDKDSVFVNYVLHPYWGGGYYIRARERGLDRGQSFWFSALLSTLWEYGVEALFEPVSIQDLVVTPVAGFLVGEYLFAPLRAHIRDKRGELDWSDKLLLMLTDPLGAINGQVDQLLGVKTTLQLAPVRLHAPAALGVDGSPPLAAGASMRTGGAKAVWGLQLRMTW
jgi:hypothetical protein